MKCSASGRNYEIAKISGRNLLQNHWDNYNQLKLGTKHNWVEGIQVYSKEGPRPFSRGNDKEIAKIH